jgi:hypothetical protein
MKPKSPHVIIDTMPPTEQVDGRFYESKAAFRAKGRELGLTEVGDQNLNRRPKAYTNKSKDLMVDALRKVIAEWHAGRRPRR